MTRTTDEILARIKELKASDFFGFQTGDLIGYLPFGAAKPFLKEGVTGAEWKQDDASKEAVTAAMRDYMSFAWDKANNCRGISAGRSIAHMQAWLWMLGEDDVANEIEDYDLYGKPQLRAICEHFGWDWKQWDDGEWRNNEGDDGVPAPERFDPLPFRTAA